MACTLNSTHGSVSERWEQLSQQGGCVNATAAGRLSMRAVPATGSSARVSPEQVLI